jgi:hypothetical protein
MSLKTIITAAASSLMFLSVANANSFIMQCYEPSGTRIEATDNDFESTPDGYSKSNPTFVYLQENPAILRETWAAANPYPDILDRSEVDSIVPPSSNESNVLKHDGNVVYAVSDANGSEAYTTTLYLKEKKAVFTRVQITLSDSFTHQPMGAVYVSECDIRWLD